MNPLRWRITAIVLITLVSLYAAAPTIIYFSQSKEVRNDPVEFAKTLPSWLPKSHVKLGLDLQGGVHFVLGVNTASAIENKLSRMAVEVARWAEEQNIGVEKAFVTQGAKAISMVLKDSEDLGVFNEKLHKEFPLLSKVEKEGNVVQYGFKETEISRIEKSALEQAERVVRSRIDAWGVTEPMINRRADGSILVQLPGFRDPQKAKELLGRTAQLKFRLVDDEFKGFSSLKDKSPEGIVFVNNGGQEAFAGEDRDALIAFLKEHVPEGHELMFSREQIGDGSVAKYRWTSYVLSSTVEITGEDIQSASLMQGQSLDHRPVVSLQMTGPGGKRFADVTGKHINKRLAIELDGVVESAPVIQSKIAGGSASITLGGGRSYNQVVEEGTQLAMVLNSGAIPATITVLEERTVGASLGPELALQGVKGAVAGFLLVLMFMIFYYYKPGIIACVALFLCAVYTLAIMAGFGFALSLPGIAGFILNLGMAVDSNVLINERIRQEIREGKHPRKAVEAGFNKVIWTIIDSHVTTMTAALVLLETNASGPIRGFATTLIIGIVVSLFTSIYCSRSMFEWVLTRKSDKDMKSWLTGGFSFIQKTLTFDFLKLTAPVTAVVSLVAVLTLAFTFTKGLNFGVDFQGGTEVQVGFENDIDAEEIRKLAEKSSLEGFSVQALDGGKKQYLLRYDDTQADGQEKPATASDRFVNFKDALMTDLAQYKPEVLQVGFVGPQVGKELRNQGMVSVLYAILAVMLYIALRFDMRFGPGAMVKMFLDIFILMGFYAFYRASFDLVAVAACLTVVGYSVNDTIVIYDRIRENLILYPRRNFRETVNMSLNETLGRSINTSLTTAISLIGILIFGTGQIWSFAMAMTLGIVIATISSIFVAPFFVLWFEELKKNRLQKTQTA